MSPQAVWWASDASDDEALSLFLASKHQILLVADTNAYELCGASEALGPRIEHADVRHFPINMKVPDASALAHALQQALLDGIDLILAVGGGTTIDMAKLLRFYGGDAQFQWASPADRPERKSVDVPLLAIPTTSGSGSEATHFAVVYVQGEKVSIADSSIVPEFVYLNASFTHTLPFSQRVASGLDALAQGIESYWSTGSSPQSKAFSTVAIEQAWNHLAGYVSSPDEAHAQAMSIASHHAGKAINHTKTTACHALSYTMTYTYGIPHGIAVAITLGPMLAYNAAASEEDVQDARGAAYVQSTMEDVLTLLGYSTAEEACRGIQDLLDTLVGGHTLSHLGIKGDEQIRALVDGVNLERLGNNPRRVTRADLLNVLRSLA